MLPDLTNALLNEWRKIPTETLQNLVQSLPRRIEAFIAANVEPMSVYLEGNVIEVPVGVMVRFFQYFCPYSVY